MDYLNELLETEIELKGTGWRPVVGATYWNPSKNLSIAWQCGVYQSTEPFYYAELDPNFFKDFTTYDPKNFIVYGKDFHELFNNWLSLVNDKGE